MLQKTGNPQGVRGRVGEIKAAKLEMAALASSKPSCTMVVASDAEELSAAAVRYVAERSAESIDARGKFVVALSGGSMPKLLAPLASVRA